MTSCIPTLQPRKRKHKVHPKCCNFLRRRVSGDSIIRFTVVRASNLSLFRGQCGNTLRRIQEHASLLKIRKCHSWAYHGPTQFVIYVSCKCGLNEIKIILDYIKNSPPPPLLNSWNTGNSYMQYLLLTQISIKFPLLPERKDSWKFTSAHVL